jgi:hypothetical protein
LKKIDWFIFVKCLRATYRARWWLFLQVLLNQSLLLRNRSLLLPVFLILLNELG